MGKIITSSQEAFPSHFAYNSQWSIGTAETTWFTGKGYIYSFAGQNAYFYVYGFDFSEALKGKNKLKINDITVQMKGKNYTVGSYSTTKGTFEIVKEFSSRTSYTPMVNTQFEYNFSNADKKIEIKNFNQEYNNGQYKSQFQELINWANENIQSIIKNENNKIFALRIYGYNQALYAPKIILDYSYESGNNVYVQNQSIISAYKGNKEISNIFKGNIQI